MRYHTITLATLFMIGMVIGCDSAPARKDRPVQELIQERQKDDEARAAESQQLVQRLVEFTKRKLDAASTTTQPSSPPTIDILVISGGGDWGAFGAGVLKGWGKVTGDYARPKFDVVTGVSTGALIAPFAFLGDDASIEQIVQLYRHPQEDWTRSRSALYFWPSNPSFYTLPGLERDLKKVVDVPMLQRIVNAGQDGRELLFNTTNIDYGDIHVWDIVKASWDGVQANSPDAVQNLMLASAGIPGVFPSRDVGGCLYVDGAITSNIVYGGRMKEEDSLWAVWHRKYPDAPMPRVRYWVIFNNQFRFQPQVTQPKWPDIIGRATIMSTQSSTVNAMRHLYAMAEIAKLKRSADVEVRVLAVPDSWVPPKPGVFIPEVMNELADLGEKLGADPGTWRTEAP